MSTPGQIISLLYSRLADLCDELDHLVAQGEIQDEPANLAVAKRTLIEVRRDWAKP
jgi:hypothetical protein